MIEENIEAYRHLIKELQIWRDGYEWAFLQQIGEMINSDFIQIIERVVEDAAKKGEEHAAYILIPFANQLAEVLRLLFLI
ncbi:MAG: hypothetical protein JO235_03305, partial [Chroococcidiopsidaceae cyanobacterium CP_BM_RX_35]|nr:hypothetical protein [Chroococcidiopsidaceae cyanobacterium CP_BM_RX_35]